MAKTDTDISLLFLYFFISQRLRGEDMRHSWEFFIFEKDSSLNHTYENIAFIEPAAIGEGSKWNFEFI